MTARANRPATALPLVGMLMAGLVFAGCAQTVTPSPTPAPSATPLATASPSSPATAIVPAPGSGSAVYEPNPAAIVVAIDPGHGGCLDWGVPDPFERGVAYAEKTMTLAIGLELRRLLEAEGITVVMTREEDVVLAGDDYAPLGCEGPAWHDVNGDGESGFRPDDPEGAVRTRDELQARLDLANLARADVLISIHINALTQDDVPVAIAATETYYTDETAWGISATEPLARLIQDALVSGLETAAAYDREDRGIKAHNLYMVAPPLLVETPERPDRRKQPTRGALMPSVLTEVGSITLPAEHDLLASAAGQLAASAAIAEAIGAYLADRALSVRYDALMPGGEAGAQPAAIDGDGPMFWAPVLPATAQQDGIGLRLTNTGANPWPVGMSLLAAWSASDQPFLRLPPDSLGRLDVEVPALAPGESVELSVSVAPPPGGGRQVLWVTLADGTTTLTDLGSPPLQISWSPSP